MEDFITQLVTGLQGISNPGILALIIAGVFAGIIIGILPGLSPSIGVALILPVTYRLDPLGGLALLTSVYLASNYGGSITAILINTPGIPSSVATSFDGYPLTQKGKAKTALMTSLVSSTIGGVIGCIILIMFSLPLAGIAMHFESYEYFALGIWGLTAVASLSGDSMLKGFIAVSIGLLLTTIGYDPQLPFSRFNLGISQLADGIGFIPALIGLFALGEAFSSLEKKKEKLLKPVAQSKESNKEALQNSLKMKKTIFRSSLTGSLIGCIPGEGGSIATLIAYNSARQRSKKPKEFGKGSAEGVAAPEAANNASVGGALIPLLTLGIPGSASTAVLLGAFLIHDLSPGPELFENQSPLVYGIFISLLFANIIMFFTGLIGFKLWSKITKVSKGILHPMIIALAFVGSYFLHQSFTDVIICFTFGLMGWLLRKGGIPAAPVILGLILGPMIEENLRLSLLKGSYTLFFTRPASIIIWILTISSLFLPLVRKKAKPGQK